MIRKLIRRSRNLAMRIWYRRNYYLARLIPRAVPFLPLPYVPNGFAVHRVGNTGIQIIDNFVTAEEAGYLIETARGQLKRSGVIVKGDVVFDAGRTSAHAVMFHRYRQDPRILPIIARGAMLAGVPPENAEQIYVSRYQSGELYHGHYDVSDDFKTSHRLCTILVYLNEMNEQQGGATYFRDLNVAIRPKTGRAVCWTNTNPDGSIHRETLHAALPPVGEETEKWVIQLWFRPYRMHRIHEKLPALQAVSGLPLKGDEALPPGTWFKQQNVGSNFSK